MEGELKKLLGPSGPLARAWADFEPRPGQLAMALEAWRAFRDDDFAIIEAGTGTGKTLAYLLPALLSGKKTVVSTGLKNLQDQIYEKDLPFIREYFGDNFRAALLKGRENYLCLHYLKKSPPFRAPAEAEILRRLAALAPAAERGDQAEFNFPPEKGGLWAEVSASAERCLGQRCPEFGGCFLWKARRAAAAADLVLVNHHLFLADLAVRAGGFGEVLPPWEAAVFDEAHLLEEAATGYFGRRLSAGALAALGRDLETALAGRGETDSSLKPLAAIFLRQAEALEGLVRLEGTEKELWAEGDPDNGPLRDFLLNFHHDALSLSEALKAESLRDDDDLTAPLAARLARTADDLLFIGEAADRNYVYQAERQGRRLTLSALPIEVSRPLNEHLFQSGRTLIFTSATLSSGGDFSHFKSRLGLWPELTGLSIESPFDYRRRVLTYIPASFPEPGAADFPEALAEETLRLLVLSRGRALVLFTSHKNMDYVAGRLSGRLPWPLLTQGRLERSAALAEFARQTHSVLLATHSFWQGVDVPGESLSAVIIEKLPFPRPDRPLIKARAALMAEEGLNPFRDYFLPEAALTLKQGLGRLMRRRRDQGLLAILDIRLRRRNYAARLLKALPPAPLTSDLAEVASFFEHI